MALNPSTGWSYYKRLDISDFNSDYQVKLTVYSGSGTDSTNIIYCDNKCSSFPNDIRFGTTNNPETATQLPQWIEESDSSSATIWVKLPSTTTSSIYIFVGNSSASQYSSGEDTFILFDDFDDSSVDSQWSTTGTVTESGTEITLDGSTSSHAYIKSTTSYGTGYAVRCKMKYVHHATWDASECGFNALEVDNDGVVARVYGNTSNIKYHSKSGGSTSTYDPGVSKDGNYHIYDIIRTSSTAVDFYIDDNNHLTGSTNIPTNDLPVTIFARGTASGYVTTTVSDWVVLRLYSSPEPSLSPTGNWKSATEPEFAGGTGTESDPYLISNWHHLNNIRNYNKKYFKLIADLDSSSDFYDDYASNSANGGSGWDPIGTGASPWQGVFDGDGHFIKDIYINRTGSYLGLFGFLGSATDSSYTSVIKNLNIYNADINVGGNNLYRGILAGWANYTLIYNCSISGTITKSNGSAEGGIIGALANRSYISSCSVNLTVHDSNNKGWVGGLVGELTSNVPSSGIYNSNAKFNYTYGGQLIGGIVGKAFRGFITKSYASSNITNAGNYVGGLFGDAPYLTVKITNSYSIGKVYGSNYVGGIGGNGGTGLSVENTYTRAEVSGSNYVGGLIGKTLGSVSKSYAANKKFYYDSDNVYGGLVASSNSSLITDSFWDKNLSVDISMGGTGKTSTEMRAISTYTSAGWDIESYKSNINNFYPVLSWQVSPNSPVWYLPICEKDLYIKFYNGDEICVWVSRWDHSDYTFTIETWMNKSDFNKLYNHIKPGAVGELYKILDRPYYYDKTWSDYNTIVLEPNENSSSNFKYLRNTTVGYVRNIVASPLEGPSKYIAVKIECFVSGSTL